ncbi:MAG: YebC/PmpR family DNA-binding transcriptional regulator [Candidatus Dadabacteria bacterium]|nr:MAG: YebC/PmpR family DNA-binding transcriptional regulator [Candidatus Dadabacteria bacterium]
MAGHSKWAQIKRKKAAIDAKRGKLFTKLLREIQVAARLGGGNPEANPRLRNAILAAKAGNVPADNIEKAIKRGTGDLEGVSYEETVYEGYGPGGVAILIKALTDNKNRTVSEVRHILTKHGGSMGGANSVAYLFSEKAQFVVERKELKCTEEELFEKSIESGAEDIEESEEVWIITGPLSSYEAIRSCLESVGAKYEGSIVNVPSTTVKVGEKEAESLLRLIEALEELDDVKEVSANFEIEDEVMNKIAQG